MSVNIAIPAIALSVRQPWAWAIVEGYKDVENRTFFAVANGRMRRGRIAVHASVGMTQDEYHEAAAFMRARGVTCPPPAELHRGGIIGAVDVVDIVKTSGSPWFMPGPACTRPRGLLLCNPVRCKFTPAKGELGFFTWKPTGASTVPEPARWMLAHSSSVQDVPKQPSLL